MPLWLRNSVVGSVRSVVYVHYTPSKVVILIKHSILIPQVKDDWRRILHLIKVVNEVMSLEVDRVYVIFDHFCLHLLLVLVPDRDERIGSTVVISSWDVLALPYEATDSVRAKTLWWRLLPSVKGLEVYLLSRKTR